MDESPSRREATCDRIDRVLFQEHVDDHDIDALGAAGWHPQSASTGQYEVIASGKLKLTEAAGAAVVDYRFERGRLVLSGDGLAQILGTATAPQALDQGD